jgi:hypothetical protein
VRRFADELSLGQNAVAGWSAQVIEPDLTGFITAVRGKEAGLEGQKRQGVAFLGCLGTLAWCAHQHTGVGVQTAGEVDAQNGGAVGTQDAKMIGQQPFGRATAAKAQQGINGEIEA